MSIWIKEAREPETPRQETVALEVGAYMKALSDYLFKELSKRECSPKDLGAECGLCTREIEKILNRKAPGIRLATFLKIAQGLGIKTSILMEKMEENI